MGRVSTFHSVYISTKNVFSFLPSEVIYIPLCLYQYSFACQVIYSFFHLHSTLFILVRKNFSITKNLKLIYIPLCLYQYTNLVSCIPCRLCIYIPLCLYQYRMANRYRRLIKGIYIPLCLYQYVCFFLNVSFGVYLHSTLFILVLQAVESSEMKRIGSTFHSVYISTIRRI